MNWCLFGVHKVFEAPKLFGIAEVEFNLKAQAIIEDKFVIVEVQVATEEDDMGAFLGGEFGLHNDNDIEQVGEGLTP